MTLSALRVLCLDIEGGYGGSSRSLYYLIKHMDRNVVHAEVWCRRDGPIVSKYEEIGIPVRIEPRMPALSSLPRFSRNIVSSIRYLDSFNRSRQFRVQLRDTIRDRFDVVHFNHEGFYGLAVWLRSRVKASFVMHNRTLLPGNWFARLQARSLIRVNEVNIFITERERDNIQLLANWKGGEVIHNVVQKVQQLPGRHAMVPVDNKFNVACLANYSWLRGLDRLIDVAMALRSMNRDDVRFIIAGNCRLVGNLPGLLGQIASRGGSLADYAESRGVLDRFIFVGHISEPEKVLAASHALVKPSRLDNPWGRDVLEALSVGLPVLACGTYDKFVRPGETGYLYEHAELFSPGEMARGILSLIDDIHLYKKMKEAAPLIVDEHCNGVTQAKKLTNCLLRSVQVRSKKISNSIKM